MNNNIQTQFTIKDLENLSGIKAHTIRIWEKRYNLLSPERTDTNIRYYSVEDLQKLLNVSLLYNNGFKISKVAALSNDDLIVTVREFALRSDNSDYAVSAFKLSMLNFDYQLFNQTYSQLTLKKSFNQIFLESFAKLLYEIGLLWQTSTISPAHEHFISNLIKQKLHIQIEKAQALEVVNKNKVFILFLPLNEIHELGLMFIHMYLLLNGYTSIYLGQSIPIESLRSFQFKYEQITYISYFTVMPYYEELKSYIEDVESNLIRKNNDQIYIVGKKDKLSQLSGNQVVKLFNSLEDIVGFI